MILALKGDGKGSVWEMEPSTKVMNATCTVWNFHKPAVGAFYFGGLV